jgi:hypothetical protein
MRNVHASQVFFFLMMVFIILLACNLPSAKIQNQSVTESNPNDLTLPTQTLIPTHTLMPTHTLILDPTSSSRCDLYSEDTFSIHILTINPGDASVLVYTKFPHTVVGLEDHQDDGLPWDYTATLGESASIWCRLFEGEVYTGRLYCMLPLLGEYRNTAQPFDLYVNECETPIFSVANLSLMVEKSPASGDDHSGQLQKICGDEPPGHLACMWEHELWCICMGGFYSCDYNDDVGSCTGY